MRVPEDAGVVEVGVDESGRGSIISVVVAGAVIMPPLSKIPEPERHLYMAITDSKKLTAAKRDKLAAFIKQYAVAWGAGVIDADEIDRINILQATMKAMHIALDQVRAACYFDKILVDGNRFVGYNEVPHECIVKGDAKELCIAAASIIAKTEHDKIIKDLIASDPEIYGRYNLVNNMGYGTKQHIDAIKLYGLTPKHRRTFVLKGLSGT